MARWLGIFAVAASLAACGATTAESRSARVSEPARPTCARADSHTIASDRVARVYSWHSTVYGCALGRTYRLGAVSRSISESRVGPVALAGEDVAYGLATYGVDTGSTEVVVRRLTSGKTLHRDSATSRPLGPEAFQSVDSLVLRRDGAVAWIGQAQSIVSHSREVEVVRDDRRGEATLDEGTAIATGSLRLNGSTLTWKHGGATRSAALS